MATDQLSMFGAEEILKTKGGKAVSFNLSKSINGPQQSVFDHWLIPVFVGEWMFGPKIQAEEIITLNNIVRKNGSFEYAVNRAGKKVVSSGEFVELDIPNRITVTWRETPKENLESQITANFLADGSKTRLKLTVKLPAELEPQRDTIRESGASAAKPSRSGFRNKSALTADVADPRVPNCPLGSVRQDIAICQIFLHHPGHRLNVFLPGGVEASELRFAEGFV